MAQGHRDSRFASEQKFHEHWSSGGPERAPEVAERNEAEYVSRSGDTYHWECESRGLSRARNPQSGKWLRLVGGNRVS